jgi:hypothetical protein
MEMLGFLFEVSVDEHGRREHEPVDLPAGFGDRVDDETGDRLHFLQHNFIPSI